MATFGITKSDQLNNVKLRVYNSSICANVYPSMIKNWNTQICAGDIDGGKDTCQGDSGGDFFESFIFKKNFSRKINYKGPLYVLDTINGKSKYVLAGITSYGYQCAVAG
jgi:hypothetical protein